MVSGPHPPSKGSAPRMHLTPTVPTTELPVTYPSMPGQTMRAQNSGSMTADAGNVQTDGTGTAPTSEQQPIAPPSGPITDRAPCCPDVATFEGSTGGWQTYFGFDDKTNSVENKGQDEYWSPPNKGKTLPGDKETRDGARWVSVAVDKEAQVEVNFGGNFTNGCLANCTYEVEPSHIAEVTSPLPTSSGAALKIKGLSEGEASLKVMCNGELKGYFHIWCKKETTIKVDIVRIKSKYSRSAEFDVEKLGDVLNNVYGQALIAVNLQDHKTVDLSDNEEFGKFEAYMYLKNNGKFDLTDTDSILGIIYYTQEALIKQKKIFRENSIPVYFYIPDKHEHKNDLSGRSIGISMPPIFIAQDMAERLYGVVPHEIAHGIGLYHPEDMVKAVEEGYEEQFPWHQYVTLNKPTKKIPKTNTEPEVPAGMGGPADRINGPNMMADDPLNLMGYYPDYNLQIYLRYRQWKALYKRAKKWSVSASP